MRAVAAALLLALTACGATAPTPETTLPERPAEPEGWRTISTEDGDLIVAVPRDATVTDAASGTVAGFRERNGAVEWSFTIMAPGALEQPGAGESVSDWMARFGYLTAGPDTVLDMRERTIVLPSGRAIEASAEHRSAHEEGWAIVTAIDTGRGLGLIQMSGPGPLPQPVPDELSLITSLVAFPPR